jgi:GntP family gluconate:H+ symporter
MHPTLILIVGMATILGAILLLRLNAFLALIIAAIVVSLLAPGEPAAKMARVAEGFGRTAGTVGIVIALAAIAGKAMMDSGAADRIVKAFLALLGEKRGATALCATGYVLSIPVFFDTVFYLLVPLARSMHGRTNRNYLKYLLAIAAGAGATHTLVPPTPGPLAIAGTLGVDLGTMVLVGIAVALPAAGAGLLFAGWVDRRMPVVPRAPAAPALGASAREAAALPLPGLVSSFLPIILPVLFISSHTVVASMTARPGAHLAIWSTLAPYTAIIGNPNLALLVAAAVAMWVYARERRVSRADLAEMVDTSLMSAGVMILIIAASGAFGVALQATEIGPVIERAFVGRAAASGMGSGLVFLFLGFGVASLIKIAQGSSTVAMITTAAMLAAMLPANGGGLPFHTVYVATAIASGSLVGTWMNDSGFWLFSKMGGVTEIETLKSWTPVLAIVGVTAMVTTVALAVLVPLR